MSSSTSTVEVYEAPAELPNISPWGPEPPLAWDSPVTDASETLAPELSEPIEYIEAKCFVHVTPNERYDRPHYGTVEVVNIDAQKALVGHISGTRRGWYGVDELKVIYGAEAQKKTPATEVTSVS